MVAHGCMALHLQAQNRFLTYMCIISIAVSVSVPRRVHAWHTMEACVMKTRAFDRVKSNFLLMAKTYRFVRIRTEERKL